MDIFSNYQVANECLFDKRRTVLFKKAISQVVKKGDIVLDAGTGTGILALFAAQAGAKKVYACDIAEDVLLQAKNHIAHSPYRNVISLLHMDMKKFDLEKNVDVIIMEMLDTGLIAEQQGEVILCLKQNKVIGESTTLIPSKAECYIELINYNFRFYGFEMPMIIQARNYGANNHILQRLTKPVCYETFKFSELSTANVNSHITLSPFQAGEYNAVRLRTRIQLAKGIFSWGTTDMNMPIILPLEKGNVKKGQKLRLSINYKMGAGYGKCHITIKD